MVTIVIGHTDCPGEPGPPTTQATAPTSRDVIRSAVLKTIIMCNALPGRLGRPTPHDWSATTLRTTARFALLLTAVTGLSGLAVAPATAAPVVTIDTGHVDVFGVAYEDDEFHLHVHDEAGDVEHEPSEVLLV